MGKEWVKCQVGKSGLGGGSLIPRKALLGRVRVSKNGEMRLSEWKLTESVTTFPTFTCGFSLKFYNLQALEAISNPGVFHHLLNAWISSLGETMPPLKTT